MPYVAPRDLVTKVPRATRWSFKLPHWSKQTPAEGALAAARMRDHKSLQAAPKRAAAQRRTVDTALQALRETGLLRDGARSVANIKGSILSITLPQGSSVQLPAIAMTELAFSDIQRRSDVGRAFKVDPRTACRVRSLVAKVTSDADAFFVDSTTVRFEAKPPKIFCAGIGGDATTETINLPFAGISEVEELRHLGRNPWHVMVTLQSFA